MNLIHMGDSREDQKMLLIASGFKTTGITAMDGRFEIYRQPKGEYGSAFTWTIWDYVNADKTSIYGIRTLRHARESLQTVAEVELKHELRMATDKKYSEMVLSQRDSS